MAYRKTETVLAQLAARREAIVDAATELVERGGREALTSARLAEAAEVSEGGLYKHFPDMSEVWAAVVARALQGDLDALQEAREGARPWQGLHAALFALYRRFTRRQLREAMFADERYRAGLQRALRPMLADCLPEADPRVALSAAIVGTLAGLYQSCGQAQGAAAMAADFVLKGLGADVRALAAVAVAR